MPGVTTRTTSRAIKLRPCDWPSGGARLFGNGDFVPGLNQARQVRFGGMIRNACHRDTLSLAHIAARQHHLADIRDDTRIVVEGFVKIAQPEKDDGVRVLLLDTEVLLADWGSH